MACSKPAGGDPEAFAQLTSQREVIAARAIELNHMKKRLDCLIESAQETLVPADA